MAGGEDESWRVPTGLRAPSGLGPSPGLAPPSGEAPPELSSWEGFEPVAAPELPPIETETTAETMAEAQVESAAAAAPIEAPANGAPGTAAPAPAAAPKPRRTARTLVASSIGAALVAAALGIITAGNDGDEPESVVQDFFEALRSGDPASAAGLLSDASPSTLAYAPIDPATADSAELAGAGMIEGVEVGDVSVDDARASVDVEYTIGGHPIATTLTLERLGEEWRIVAGGTGSPRGALFSRFPVTVNGRAVGGQALELLPGAYELGFDTDAFEFADPDRLLIVRPEHGEESVEVDAAPRLSEAGANRFASALDDDLGVCLDSGAPATPCGMDLDLADLPDGYELVGGLERTLDPAFDQVIAANPPQLERGPDGLTGSILLPAEFAARIDLQVRRTSDGRLRSGHMRDPEYSLRPRGRFSGDVLRIEWIAPDPA